MSQYIYGIHAVIAALKQSSNDLETIWLQDGRDDQRLQEVLTLAKSYTIPAKKLAKKKLDKMVANAKHQGVIAVLSQSKSYSETDLEEILENLTKPAFLLILDGVQDPHNLGACLRSANAAGVDAVIAPKDKAVGITDVVRKVASGAVESTPFIQVSNLARTMRQLKEQGIWLYGADDAATDSIYEMELSGAMALVLGAEGSGLRRLSKELCDFLVNIPMAGSVSSLNVSVAAGVCLFEAVRQRIKVIG